VTFIIIIMIIISPIIFMMIYIISLKNMIRNNEVYVMQMSKLSTR